MIEIIEVTKPDEKSGICNGILRALPNWFGVEEALVDYVRQSCTLTFYAAFELNRPVGFVAIKTHGKHTAEVCVMGVLSEYHHRGIGRRLIECCEQFCVHHGMEFLTVKTLDESNPDEGYAKTRLFYQSMGFKPLEVFPLLWDENNPCLFMAKHIALIS